MFTIVTVLIFFVCILMILIVLVQNSKGGGLAANFSSANQVMGVRKTTDFLEKGTWTLAGALLVLCIMASAFIPRGEVETDNSMLQEKIEETAEPFMQQGNFPTAAPAAEESAE
ncbi:MAG: preprotein translocase subunit SecG [Salinivirgaceae bacterium]|nr:preprotein translocase subunit SecG [Salinivirgaceae bacterium]